MDRLIVATVDTLLDAAALAWLAEQEALDQLASNTLYAYLN